MSPINALVNYAYRELLTAADRLAAAEARLESFARATLRPSLDLMRAVMTLNECAPPFDGRIYESCDEVGAKSTVMKKTIDSSFHFTSQICNKLQNKISALCINRTRKEKVRCTFGLQSKTDESKSFLAACISSCLATCRAECNTIAHDNDDGNDDDRHRRAHASSCRVLRTRRRRALNR